MRDQIFNAVSIDSLLYQQIKDHRFTGRVHSIFNDALNIEMDHLDLVTIISPRKYHGPGFIKACPFPSLREELTVGTRAVLTGDELVFPSSGVRISLDDARPWRTRGRTTRIVLSEELLAKRSLLQEALGSHGDGQDAIDRGVDELLRSIMSGDPGLIKKGLGSIIGLGDGLTPAADDIILGLVCFIHLVPSGPRGCRLNDFLKSFSMLLEDWRDSTTFISYSFLKFGSDGRFIEPLSELCRAILSKGKSGLESNLKKLLSVGAGSGSNMLRGVVHGVDLYIERDPQLKLDLAH